MQNFSLFGIFVGSFSGNINPRGVAGDETLASNHLELNLVSRRFVVPEFFFMVVGKFEDRE